MPDPVTIQPDPGLASVLCEIYPAEPVVQYAGFGQIRILGGSYNVGTARVFISTTVIVDTVNRVAAPENLAFPMSVWLDSDNWPASPDPGKDWGVYLGTDGGIRFLLYDGDETSVTTDGTAVYLRCLGGFHTLCYSVGVLGMRPASAFPGVPHPLSNFNAGDILPKSVWAVNFRPDCPNPTGMVHIPETNTWIDIYLASGPISAPKSVYNPANTIVVQDYSMAVLRHALYGYAYQQFYTVNAPYSQFMTGFANVGKRLPSSDEFYFASLGSNCRTIVRDSSSLDPHDNYTYETLLTAGAWYDTGNERMISSIGCEAMCGLLNQWLQERYVPSDAGYTDTYVAPGGRNAEGMFASGTRILIAGGSWKDVYNNTPVSGPMCRRVYADNNAFTEGHTYIGARGACGCRQCAR